MDIPQLIYTQWGIGALAVAITVGTLYKLSVDLAKLRTDVAYTLSKDLLARRFEAYGALWSKMRKIAIYSDHPFDAAEAGALATELSDWYFSDKGGMFLTAAARDYYFAFQDSLRAVESLGRWRCASRPVEPKLLFEDFVKKVLAGKPHLGKCLDHLDANKPRDLDSKAWSDGCKDIVAALQTLATKGAPDAGEKIYVCLQQISSVLRTRLTREVSSRLDVDLPHA